MKLNKVILAGVIAGVVSAGAFAQDEESVKVTASVAENCKIQSAEDINFGLLDPSQATDAQAAGSVKFACTHSVDYTVNTDNGSHFDADENSRRMKGGDDNYLPYKLADDSFSGEGRGFSNPISIRLDASLEGADYKDLPSADYKDTLVVTITP